MNKPPLSSTSETRTSGGWQDQEEESATLLPPSEKDSIADRRRTSYARRIITNILPWFLNAVFLTSAVIYFTILQQSGGCPYPNGSVSPADTAVEYIPVKFRRGFGAGEMDVSPYQGWPNDEQDKLWEELYEAGLSIHISASEHALLLNKTERIPIPGLESQYLMGVDVFHQLHCLNMLRKALYPGRYPSSALKSADGKSVNYGSWLHLDHCIESLRQSLTCHSDTSPNTFRWLQDTKILEPSLGTVHICRNFSRIREWTSARFVDVDPAARRRHVEKDGEIVDYADRPNPEVAPHAGDPPEEWRGDLDDL